MTVIEQLLRRRHLVDAVRLALGGCSTLIKCLSLALCVGVFNVFAVFFLLICSTLVHLGRLGPALVLYVLGRYDVVCRRLLLKKTIVYRSVFQILLL